MIFFIMLILMITLSSFYIYYSFSTKLENERKKLILFKQQNDNLKSKINSTNNNFKNLKIRFSMPNSDFGIVTNPCNVYLYPSPNAPILSNITSREQIKVYAIAEFNNSMWCDVSFFSHGMINTKGWINLKNIQLIK